ncbi:hypothetical protein [Microlunatus antarcticus]
MWGFQPHFRVDFEAVANESLNSIGVIVAPMVLLVGFAEEPTEQPICVEPENAGIAPEILAGCMTAGDAAYESHENRNIPRESQYTQYRCWFSRPLPCWPA